MTNEQFEETLKRVLAKAKEASNLNHTIGEVSTDPDCVTDFGCDGEGNLVLNGYSFPLKISDMTNIRYHWDGENINEGYIRFDFGDDLYFNCIYDDYGIAEEYIINYKGTEKTCLDRKEAISALRAMKKEA